MAFKPSRKKKRPLLDAEANLTPVMNLICVLIPMLLGSAKFVDLALLEYTPPLIQETGFEAGGGGGEGGGYNALLELRVNVTYDALEVSTFNATSGENYVSLAKQADGSYDYEGLRRKLVDIKQRVVGPPVSISQEQNQETGKMEVVERFKFSDADQVRISAEGDVPLQTIIRVLDTCREYQMSDGAFHPLFPSPALGQLQ